MSLLSLNTPATTQKALADWCRQQRKANGFKSRKAFSEVCGVPAETIKRFENTGLISLSQFLLIFSALDSIDKLNDLIQQQPKPKSIAEIKNG